MTKSKDKVPEMYVYYDKDRYSHSIIDEKYLNDPDALKKYFGSIEDHLDKNNQLIIYKLVPFRVLKREEIYKFI